MLIEHHVKYKEIHGKDVIILMEQSDHKKLHARLRKEGKCNIPVDELRKIHKRSETVRLKERIRRKKNISVFVFHERQCKNIRIRESIQYNCKTESISVSSNFEIRGK